MGTTAADARALFRVAPADYVTERTRLVKAAKTAGDKAGAAELQALKRPNLPMWAVLAAADDDAVRFLVTATAEVAQTQAAGGNSAAIAAAMQHRATAIDALIDRAVHELAQFDTGAETRRAEIRGLIDQLSRHAALVDPWLDGTLRDLPDESLGFTAFTETTLSPPPATSEKPKPKESRETTAERTARAERVALQRQARKDIATATRDVIAATRRVEAATAAVQAAQEALHAAEAECADAEQRRTDAERRLATATS